MSILQPCAATGSAEFEPTDNCQSPYVTAPSLLPRPHLRQRLRVDDLLLQQQRAQRLHQRLVLAQDRRRALAALLDDLADAAVQRLLLRRRQVRLALRITLVRLETAHADGV